METPQPGAGAVGRPRSAKWLRAAVLLLPLASGAPAWAQMEATVQVDAAKVLHAIPRTIYGTFLEPIGHSTYGGLWAQILENPSFEDNLWSAGRIRQMISRAAGTGPGIRYWNTASLGAARPVAGRALRAALGRRRQLRPLAADHGAAGQADRRPPAGVSAGAPCAALYRQPVGEAGQRAESDRSLPAPPQPSGERAGEKLGADHRLRLDALRVRAGTGEGIAGQPRGGRFRGGRVG